jgi:hypothetical protein
MAKAPGLTPLGRAIAKIGNEAVAIRDRPPLDERVARLRHDRPPSQSQTSDSLKRPVGIGLALGIAAAALILWPAPAPLTFAVGDPRSPLVDGEPAAPGESGAWIMASAGQTVPVGFSDGTRVKLEPLARVRVLDLTAHGARVAIERGSVRADVAHQANNDWSFVGGPFEIHVTGTSFDAAWDPEREELHVAMHEGRVVVRAGCLKNERALVAGDSAVISCTPSRVTASLPTPSASVMAKPITPADPSSPAPSEAVPLASAEASAGASAESSLNWRELSKRGDYKGALTAAESEGGDWAALCNSLSAADLLELGTIARLAGKSGRAVDAYSAIRRRFSGTDAAATSAFHLGQIAFDSSGAFSEAHRWFTTYLNERPGGALASVALGRAMEAEQRMGDLSQARDTARRYLSAYPSGAHAELAKSLVAP